MRQPSKKLFPWRKIIPPRLDLICIEVWSHLSGTNPFSYKGFVFTKWNTPFCRDLTQVRRLTWVVWFFSYQQLLFNFVTIQRDYKLNLLFSCENFKKQEKKVTPTSFRCLGQEIWLDDLWKLIFKDCSRFHNFSFSGEFKNA